MSSSRWCSDCGSDESPIGRRTSASTLASDSTVRKPNRRPSFGASDLIPTEDLELDPADDSEAVIDMPIQPTRRDSKVDVHLAITEDYVPPKSEWERTSLRWAQALDVDEDLTDSDFSDSDDSDWDSDSDSDSDSDTEEASEASQTLRIRTQTATMHGLTLPANKVLPFQFQTLFREVATMPNVDIQARIQQALMAGPTAA